MGQGGQFVVRGRIVRLICGGGNSLYSQGQDSKTYLWGGRFVLRGRLARLTCGGGSVCSQGQVSKTYLLE